MGLRERAEKIITEQDARRAADKQSLIDRAMELAPEALAQWAAMMGLDGTPEYTMTATSFLWDDSPRAFVGMTFEVDGIAFGASLEAYQNRHELRVSMTGADQHRVQSVADVAEGIRKLEGRERTA